MKHLHFLGLDSLIKGIAGKNINEWVLANISQLKQDMMMADYYIFPGEELEALNDDEIYENKDGAIIPVVFKDKNLDEFLEIADIESAIEYLKYYHKDPSSAQIAEALKYYYENDAFTSLEKNVLP